MNSMVSRAAPLATVVLVAGLLAGCSTGGQSGNASPDPAAALAAAPKFVSCLNTAGQNARIGKSGMVEVHQPDSTRNDSTTPPAPGDLPKMGGGGTGMVSTGPDGTWLAGSTADAYPTDGGMRAAWTGCEKKVPDFKQPEPKLPNGGQMPDHGAIVKASLAFAKCARGQGYADFADPGQDGSLVFPSGMTEDQFRSLLTACYDKKTTMPVLVSAQSSASFTFDWQTIVMQITGGLVASQATMSGGSGK